MFQSKIYNKKINTLHDRTLRATCGDKFSSFNELLEKDNSVSIHPKSLKDLVTIMYKCAIASSSKEYPSSLA